MCQQRSSLSLSADTGQLRDAAALELRPHACNNHTGVIQGSTNSSCTTSALQPWIWEGRFNTSATTSDATDASKTHSSRRVVRPGRPHVSKVSDNKYEKNSNFRLATEALTDTCSSCAEVAPVILFQPKHQLCHPETCLFT